MRKDIEYYLIACKSSPNVELNICIIGSYHINVCSYHIKCSRCKYVLLCSCKNQKHLISGFLLRIHFVRKYLYQFPSSLLYSLPAFLNTSCFDTLDTQSGKTSILCTTPLALNSLHIYQALLYVYMSVIFFFYIATHSLTAQMEMSLMNMHAIPKLSVLRLAVVTASHLALCFSFSVIASFSFIHSVKYPQCREPDVKS